MVWLPRWGCDGMITSAQKMMMARAGVKPANFPVIETTSTHVSTSSTSHSVTLPSGIVSGDFLLAFYSADGLGVISEPSGWTLDFKGKNNGQSAGFGYFYRVADGGEGSSVTVSMGVSESLSVVVLRISGASGSIDDSVANISSQNTSPDASSLTPSWGSAANLWLVSYHVANGNARLSTAPVNYAITAATENGNIGMSNTETAVVFRERAAATEDPATATLDDSYQCSMITVAIEPST